MLFSHRAMAGGSGLNSTTTTCPRTPGVVALNAATVMKVTTDGASF
jgi:hypothetical protein